MKHFFLTWASNIPLLATWADEVQLLFAVIAWSCSWMVEIRLFAPLKSREICCSLEGSVHLANSLLSASAYRCSFSSINRKVWTLWLSNWRNFSCWKNIYNSCNKHNDYWRIFMQISLKFKSWKLKKKKRTRFGRGN